MLDKLLSIKGNLIVLSGPSGSGKDTVLDALYNAPCKLDKWARCVTATTRSPRAAEVDGVDYHFLSREQFEERIKQNYFLEYARYSMDYYGTPAENAEQMRFSGIDVVLKIEVQGALAVKARVPEAILVFLAPPNEQELERRLRNRSTDSENEVNIRLITAKNELMLADRYDYIIHNHTVDKAAQDLRAIIMAERLRIKR